MYKRKLRRQQDAFPEPEGGTLVFLNDILMEIINAQKAFKAVCLSGAAAGRKDLERRLRKAHKTFFNNEEMSYWLEKMMQNAKVETDKIAFEVRSTSAFPPDKINFEKVGFYAGRYEAANWYLNEISTSLGAQANSSRELVYDRLEKLDAYFAVQESLRPGYYHLDKNRKLANNKFDLRSLEEYWKDLTAVMKKHKLPKALHNTDYLLYLYHCEFASHLARLRPRPKIKMMLDYHYRKFAGEDNDFLEHIEFRILPLLENVSCTDHFIYRSLVEEWLREKRILLKRKDETFLVKSIVQAAADFINSASSHHQLSAKAKYLMTIRNLILKRVAIKGWSLNEDLQGAMNVDNTALREASLHHALRVISEKRQVLANLKLAPLSYVPQSTSTHSSLGLTLSNIFHDRIECSTQLFIIYFCECAFFSTTWEQYLRYLQSFEFTDFPLIEIGQLEDLPPLSELKLAHSVHKCAEGSIDFYHLFINVDHQVLSNRAG